MSNWENSLFSKFFKVKQENPTLQQTDNKKIWVSSNINSGYFLFQQLRKTKKKPQWLYRGLISQYLEQDPDLRWIKPHGLSLGFPHKGGGHLLIQAWTQIRYRKRFNQLRIKFKTDTSSWRVNEPPDNKRSNVADCGRKDVQDFQNLPRTFFLWRSEYKSSKTCRNPGWTQGALLLCKNGHKQYSVFKIVEKGEESLNV